LRETHRLKTNRLIHENPKIVVPVEERLGLGPAIDQLRYLGHELYRLTYGKPVRWLVLFFEASAGVIISYRLDRCFYLLFGSAWAFFRIFAFPMFLFLRILSCRHEISWKAEIGRGLYVWHPTLGVVVGGEAIIGEDCTLFGGNSIGVRYGTRRGELVLGNQVMLGINSCVLGPAKIGNRVSIGAGAIVVTDLPDDCTAVGVPAKAKTAKLPQ
jgi:serine O-acetyltransferase